MAKLNDETEMRMIRLSIIQAMLENDPKLAKDVKALVTLYC